MPRKIMEVPIPENGIIFKHEKGECRVFLDKGTLPDLHEPLLPDFIFIGIRNNSTGLLIPNRRYLMLFPEPAGHRSAAPVQGRTSTRTRLPEGKKAVSGRTSVPDKLISPKKALRPETASAPERLPAPEMAPARENSPGRDSPSALGVAPVTPERFSVHSSGAEYILSQIARKSGLADILKKYYPDTCGLLLDESIRMACRDSGIMTEGHFLSGGRVSALSARTGGSPARLPAGVTGIALQDICRDWSGYLGDPGYAVCGIETSLSRRGTIRDAVPGHDKARADRPWFGTGVLFNMSSLLPVSYADFTGRVGGDDYLDSMKSLAVRQGSDRPRFVFGADLFYRLDLGKMHDAGSLFVAAVPESHPNTANLVEMFMEPIHRRPWIEGFDTCGKSWPCWAGRAPARGHVFLDWPRHDPTTYYRTVNMNIRQLYAVHEAAESGKGPACYVVLTNDPDLTSGNVLWMFRQNETLQKYSGFSAIQPESGISGSCMSVENDASRFCGFLALVLRSIIEKDIRNFKNSKRGISSFRSELFRRIFRMTTDDILGELSSIRTVSLSEGKRHRTFLSEIQMHILDILGVSRDDFINMPS